VTRARRLVCGSVPFMRKSKVSLDDLRAAAVEALIQYQRADEAERTPLLKAAAEAFVAARERFFTKEGDPDWLGRTFAYRRWVREAFSLANVPADETTRIQGAIRWHYGAALRAHLTPEQIEDLGLRDATPAERSVEKRARQSEVLSIFAAGPELDDLDSIASALHLTELALRRVSTDAIRKLPAVRRKELHLATVAVEGLLAEIASSAVTK
jgi:hypothetical protein